jgi:hypothetical protein
VKRRSMPSDRDRSILRALATQYRELCDSDANQNKIAMWRGLNSMKKSRPMVYCNCGLLGGEIGAHLPEPRVEAEEFRSVERWLHRMLWEQTIGDDRVFYPWYTVRAEMFAQPEGTWGVPLDRVHDPTSRGWRNIPVLKRMEDLTRLKATEHRVIDPNPPMAAKLRDIFGDILPIHVSRSTIYPIWGGTDLSEAPGALFGMEELMCALYTDPDMVHKFMAFTRDAVLANLEQGEAAGDWSTADHQNYGVPSYCRELPDPEPNTHGAQLKALCFFTHAQEFEAVSPQQFEAFLFSYQVPIMELFGKVNYGCCETLDTKRDLIRKIPNLGKILSGPRSDPALYPEGFGADCVISWRPIANIIALWSFDEEAQRGQLREGLEKTKGCQVEVHMHEPMTVQGDVSRISRWAEIARQEAGKVAP